MIAYGKFLFASLLIALSLYSGVHGFVYPLAPYAVAPFARSYSAHTVNHAVAPVAAPVAAPLVAASPATYPLPFPYVAPYYATL